MNVLIALDGREGGHDAVASQLSAHGFEEVRPAGGCASGEARAQGGTQTDPTVSAVGQRADELVPAGA